MLANYRALSLIEGDLDFEDVGDVPCGQKINRCFLKAMLRPMGIYY